MQPVPLVFQPIYRPKVWGGRRLATLLGKQLPEGGPIGESWECADLPAGDSVVLRGPAAGRTLHDLTLEWGSDLLGRAAPVGDRFPLLIKFLDAVEPLSIQVHPDPHAADQLAPDEAVKHEAWYVVHADPGAVIYRGMRPGIGISDLRACLEHAPADLPALLHTIPVKAGDSFFLPSGTLHGLGAGVVVAEVQTPSDTTFRLYDWGRTRPSSDAGLHIDRALSSIIPDMNIAAFERRSHVTSIFTTVTRLVSCPSFLIEKVRFVEDVEQDIPYAELVCWIVLDGKGEVKYGPSGREVFQKGEVLILPAGLKNARLKTLSPCTWLEVTIPAPSDLAAHERPGAASLRAADAADPVQIRIDRPRAGGGAPQSP